MCENYKLKRKCGHPPQENMARSVRNAKNVFEVFHETNDTTQRLRNYYDKQIFKNNFQAINILHS